MKPERPDLEKVDFHIRAYIEALEAELERLSASSRPAAGERSTLRPAGTEEEPTTQNVITISASGQVKRTPRHRYNRQRRGGMGIFDLESGESDPPAFLVIADETQDLLLVTDQAHAYRLAVGKLGDSEVRARGIDVRSLVPVPAEEQLSMILPLQDSGYLALLTHRGYVRILRHNYVGANLRPGAPLYDVKQLGFLADGCWTPGDGDLLVLTRHGRGVRFSEKRVHPGGSLGIRLERGDEVAAITAVRESSGVFLLSADGRGTIRLMSGFKANKAPGAGGKTTMKTQKLVGAATVQDGDDLFIISRLSKIIRFPAVEVPAKEGVVQGVNCMDLRADETVALAVSPAG